MDLKTYFQLFWVPAIASAAVTRESHEEDSYGIRLKTEIEGEPAQRSPDARRAAPQWEL